MILLSYVSYFFCCLRYDKANKKGIANGYFLWLTIGYGVGEHSCRIFFDLNSVALLAHFLYIVILINESTTQQGNLSPFCFLSISFYYSKYKLGFNHRCFRMSPSDLLAKLVDTLV